MQDKIGNTVHAGKEDFYEELFSSLMSELKMLGFEQFAFYMLPRDTPVEPNIISNFPREYVKRYREEKLYLIDSVVETARHRLTPFQWRTDLTMGENRSNIFDIARGYHISDGYSFVSHDGNNNMSTLHICNLSLKEDFSERIRQNREHLQMLLLETHQRYVETLGNAGLLFARDLKNPLSDRENEVLHWASMGKTYEEIAVILDISERTVKFHMRNVVSKLEAVNAKHAIKKASEMHLLTP